MNTIIPKYKTGDIILHIPSNKLYMIVHTTTHHHTSWVISGWEDAMDDYSGIIYYGVRMTLDNDGVYSPDRTLMDIKTTNDQIGRFSMFVLRENELALACKRIVPNVFNSNTGREIFRRKND